MIKQKTWFSTHAWLKDEILQRKIFFMGNSMNCFWRNIQNFYPFIEKFPRGLWGYENLDEYAVQVAGLGEMLWLFKKYEQCMMFIRRGILLYTK